MARTLYVGNLPWATRSEDLEEVFSMHGAVISSRIIRDRQTGRSRGFGFVEVKEEDADLIIEAMNGKEMEGRVLIVNQAKVREK
ncbi:MAG TPA: RNA-binding protein [Desulfotomaculum sp.]|nr:RNA-binding protein [Desulfotomaculum sp.]